MKRLKKRQFLLALILISVLSCKKHRDTTPLPTDEFIHYTVNDTVYNYDMPADSIRADTSTDYLNISENWAFVYGDNDYLRIIYSEPVGLGNSRLFGFATREVPDYPHISTTSGSTIIAITEYGNIGEYIAGNFSQTFTNTINDDADSIQHVTCSFRVRRRQ